VVSLKAPSWPTPFHPVYHPIKPSNRWLNGVVYRMNILLLTIISMRMTPNYSYLFPPQSHSFSLWLTKFQFFLGFSGTGEVYLNTSPASEKYFYIYTYLIPLWHRRSLESICISFPAPKKYLYTLLRCRRSVYIHLYGAGEVFKYTRQNDKNSLIIVFQRNKTNFRFQN